MANENARARIQFAEKKMVCLVEKGWGIWRVVGLRLWFSRLPVYLRFFPPTKPHPPAPAPATAPAPAPLVAANFPEPEGSASEQTKLTRQILHWRAL